MSSDAVSQFPQRDARTVRRAASEIGPTSYTGAGAVQRDWEGYDPSRPDAQGAPAIHAEGGDPGGAPEPPKNKKKGKE